MLAVFDASEQIIKPYTSLMVQFLCRTILYPTRLPPLTYYRRLDWVSTRIPLALVAATNEDSFARANYCMYAVYVLV